MRKSSKILAVLGVSLFLIPSLAGCSSSDEKTTILRVLNMEDYIYEQDIDDGYDAIDLVDQFADYIANDPVKSEKYGNVTVIYDTTDTNETLYSEMQTGKALYDLICPSDYMIQKLVSSDMLIKLDKEKVPNYFGEKNNEGEFKNSIALPVIKEIFDAIPCPNKKVENDTSTMGDYAVGYMWGTLGILFNPEYKKFVKKGYEASEVIEDMADWGMLWDSKYNNTISIKDSMRDTYAVGVLKTFEDDIKTAFQPFYEVTTMDGETDLNIVYDYRNKLHEYMLFDYDDVERFNTFMASQSGKGQTSAALGKLAGMFRPIIERYNNLTEDERYVVRDYIRKFTRTYSYITQIVRLHDKELFSEYLYAVNLLKLLPRSVKDIVDIDDKVKLEYANLKETHKGAIILDEKQVIFTPVGSTAPKKPNKKKDTLQSIIDKVNDRFDGQFTESDRVIIEGIYRMFMDDDDVKKFRKYAQDNSTEMFVQSLFPDKFKEIVTQCFLENNESFQKLFNDPDFYQKVQDVMANELYKSLRNKSES